MILCEYFFNGVNNSFLIDDTDLLRAISEGDRSAFATFYDKYSKLLFSIAFRVLNDVRESEDVLQEVFLQIWNKAGNYDARLGKPSSWAVTLTRNKAIDHIRSSQRRTKLMEQSAHELSFQAGDVETANESIQGKENAQLISSAVADLPVDQRKAIEMAFFSGLTQDEISKVLREPLGTIKARIRRGMLKLKEQLEGCV